MKSVTVAIEVTYKMTKQVEKEYLAWLDDYKDTKKMRECFFTDRFISPDFWANIIETPHLLDYRNAKLTYKEND
jgi:hypothetical protein